ncbi:Acyl carrier protein, mitochondrial [Holothuria leucospilota]|uniref:Acyl carrier protein n=1 Tax=Holothuria leucospilota TaxID=206669 RepID=A0A9Q1C312_HOLLE|nr:Acyl carrier protein, mitochondrial [Holothuria leucospilota]
MATLCRLRSALRNISVLQTQLRSATHKSLATPCYKTLTCSRPVHSLNFTKAPELLRPAAAITCLRHYAELPPMTFDQLEERTLNLLKLFDKVDPDKVKVESHLINDLGLDSLDVVEIIMAIEDEFALEINDEEAEKVFTVKDIIELLGDKFDVSE